MSGRDSIRCQQFDVHADELALGQLDEPLRGQLLAHAAECPHCHSLLDSLGAVADRLLLAAPQVEPPAGFESRALARLDAGAVIPARRTTGRWWLAAAAVLVAIAVAGAVVVLQRDDGLTAATAAIVGNTGDEVGSVQLIARPTPHVLVVIPAPRSDPGIRYCELQRPDGTWEAVGWWDASDIASGVWAVGIDATLLDATAMRVTSDGELLATATFD